MNSDLRNDPLLRNVPELKGYKVLRPAVLYAKIGQGGMGAVYRGRHLNLEVDVAVKCLKPGLADNDEQFIVRFQREAKLAASIRHENLIQVYDVASDSGVHYLVMDFISGETARQRVKRKGTLSEQEAATILLGAARGLAAAHRKRIIHRDVKPDNILISADGVVKLADLGIARAVDNEEFPTLTVGALGTPQYMAPEQWMDASKIDARADVWSLGATFYFLLVGENAIRATTQGECALKICGEAFPDIRAHRNIDPALLTLLQNMTARDPAQRPKDAGEVARQLELIVGATAVDLADSDTGTGRDAATLVSPPPAQTLAQIRIEANTKVPSRSEAAMETIANTPPPASAAGGGASASETIPVGASAAKPAPAAAAQPAKSRVPLIAGGALGVLALGFAAWKFTGSGSSGEPTAGQPRISLQTPSIAGGVRPVSKRTLRVAGRVSSPVAGQDLEVEVNGARQQSPVVNGQFDSELTLRPNAQNDVVLRYGDADPVRFSIGHDDMPPRIRLRKPDDKARVKGASIDVEFEIEDAYPARASVSGVKADRQGAMWVAKGVPLPSDGAHPLVITAFDEVDLDSRLELSVERDGRAPQPALPSGGLAPLTAGRKAALELPFDELLASAKLVGQRQPWWPTRDTLTIKGKSAVLELTPPAGVPQLDFDVEVVDTLGNEQRHSVSVRLSDAPSRPWFELDGGLASGATRLSKTTSLDLAGEVHNATSDHVELLVNGKSRKAALRSGRFSTTLDLTRDDTTSVKLRHSEAEEFSLTFVHDATPPKVELLSPKSGAATRQSRQRVEFRITDRNLDPQSVRIGQRALQAAGDVWSGEVELTADGPQRFTLAVRDLAGNEAQPLEFELRRDTTAPQLVPANCQPAPGSTLKAGEKLEFVLAFDEPLGALQVNRATAKITGARGAIEISIPSGNGELELRAEFEDALGNSGVEVLRFTRAIDAAITSKTLVDPDPKPDPTPGPGPSPRTSLAWAAQVLDHKPDPSVVTNAALRSAIEATGLPWRVVDGATGAMMVLIPPGEFVQDDGKRKRTVRITRAFYCGVFEVQETEWARVMSGPASQGRPKSGVGFDDCEAFLRKVNAQSDGRLRLLTSAEWEYACRAGTSTPTYGPLDEIAVFGKNPMNRNTRPENVGSKRRNPLGLYDTLGNLYEWCSDWHDAAPSYKDQAIDDPQGPGAGSARAVRGGCFISKSSDPELQAGYNDYGDLKASGATLGFYGFRVARSVD